MNVCLHDYRIDLSKWARTVGEGIVADIAHRDSSGESGGRYLICLNEGTLDLFRKYSQVLIFFDSCFRKIIY